METRIDEKFIAATELLGRRGLTTVKQRYEESFDFESNYQYHDKNHSKLVSRRFGELASEIVEVCPGLISPEDIIFGKALAKGHDRRIVFYHAVTESPAGYELITMKRLLGANENWSADEEIEDMEAINNEAEEEIFMPYHASLVRESYEATIPGFSPEHKTVFQPKLTENTRPLPRLIAISDLGSVLLNPEGYLRDGDTLFREEQMDVLRMLINPNSPIYENEKVKEDVRGRIINWSHNQVPFAIGQMELFEGVIGPLPEGAKQVLRRHNHFCESIEASKRVALRREDMSLKELIYDLGYLSRDTRSHLIDPKALSLI